MFKIPIDFYLEDTSIGKKQLQEIFDRLISTIDNAEHFFVEVNKFNTTDHINLEEHNHISFIDLSTTNPLVMFNSGYLKAKKVPLQFLLTGERPAYFPVLNELVLCPDLTSFIHQEEFEYIVRQILRNTIENYFSFRNHIERIWFKVNAGERIYLVGGPDYEIGGSKFDNATDYIKERLNDDIYAYGDKDTFIDTCMFLSKYLNNPVLIRTVSNENKYDERENLVVIGGPGSNEEDGNILCRKLMAVAKSRISYGYDEANGFYLKRDGDKFFAKTNKKNDQLITDYGYFACFKNPFNPKKRVVLINGIHTMGVLGAFKAFADDEQTHTNYSILLKKILSNDTERTHFMSGEMAEFECFFQVPVIDNMPRVPVIRAEDIFFFDRKKTIAKKSLDKDTSTPYYEATSTKNDILNRITIRINHLPTANLKKPLEELYASISSAVLSPDQLREINKIIDSNNTIPLASINKIHEITRQ